MGSDCSIDGCTRPAVARSWCRPHWKHWRRWGDPTRYQTERPRRPVPDRFWSKGQPVASGCWEWTASRDDWGYGFFRVVPDEPMRKAHKVAWELTHGPVPEGLVVRHSCDNPPCVNPAHLLVGTAQENVDDRVARGRSSRKISHQGETSPLAKLSAADVDAIRYRYAAGGIRQRELAEEYGVAQTTISRIVRGVRWKQAG